VHSSQRINERIEFGSQIAGYFKLLASSGSLNITVYEPSKLRNALQFRALLTMHLIANWLDININTLLEKA
jgi:hypothetical protein